MALVQREDSESDEEINTDQLTEGFQSPSRYSVINSEAQKAGIVPGEESETDEEDEGTVPRPIEQVDSGVRPLPGSSQASSRESSRRGSFESTTPAPQSLLHKKLRESNVSLRRNIVDRVLRIYHNICRNLTIVNDNLSRAQGTIEKVNAHLKRSDHDLARVNAMMEDINSRGRSLAPTIRMDIVPPQKQESSSPLASFVSYEGTPEVVSETASPAPHSS